MIAACMLFAATAASASAATAPMHKKSVSGEHKLRAKSIKPNALPKTGYGGVSE